MSVTDANALLRRGDMFVLSDAQVRMLLGDAEAESDVEAKLGAGAGAGVVTAASGGGASAPSLPPALRLGRLLDVGAGDGGVTAVLARHFRVVDATEVSAPMAARLRARPFLSRVVQTAFLTPESLPDGDGAYDVVSILNVLDRTDQPAALLAAARRLLAPGGRLLLAVVLPFSEFVEDGAVRRHVHGPLPMAGARCADGADFETSLNALLSRAIIPAGFDVLSVSKVPYLCRGDWRKSFYVLFDAIIVARATSDSLAAPVAAKYVGGDVARTAAADIARDDLERAALLELPNAARRRID